VIPRLPVARPLAWPGLALLLAWLGAGSPGQAAPMEVLSRVDIRHAPLVIDHSKTIAQITRAQAGGGKPASYGVGLYLNNLKLEVSGGDAPFGKFSVLTRIATTPVIYVAREFPADSCAYAVILGHERQHHQFDLDILRALSGDIEGIAREVFSERDDSARRTRRLVERIEHAYAARSFAAHVAIDNPMAYAELAAMCDGAIRQHVLNSLK
jgi:hypothetical protein